MRADMSRVIVERPRTGLRPSRRRAPWERNASLDDLPTKEGVRKRHSAAGTRRELNENLAPLKRYLASQVGRPWNVVYREICAHIRPRSAVQLHVLQHLRDFVERHAQVSADGTVHGTRWRALMRSGQLRVGELYVHPTSGLLLAVRKTRATARRT